MKSGGTAKHTFDKQSFVLSRSCVYFFNQKDNYHVEVYEAGCAFPAHLTIYEEIETDSFCIPIKKTNEFLTEIRIKHACFLIDIYHDELSLAEISERCGYLDYIYFSKKFKSIMDVSPREYKKERYNSREGSMFY